MALVIRHNRPTAPPASAFEWPNASNTGVPAGTVLTPYPNPGGGGEIGIGGSPQTFTDRSFSGFALSLYSSGHVFNRCLFTGGGPWMINADGQNITVTDCTFVGQGTAGFTAAAVLGNGTFTRLNISACSFGLNLQGNGTIVRNCYIHDLAYGGGDPHYDGIMVQGGNSNVLVEDNWTQTPSAGGTGNMLITPQFGNISNVTVRHNRFLGTPSYSVYAVGNPNGSISGVSFYNNEMQRGYYGYWYTNGYNPTRSGNVDAFSGVNIDAAS